ncbi:anti-sigma factor [Amycolatopsis sp. NPDC049253]|uniref:anti-sigma factor n=1 Tax=Amycolatopsis sp. NPDC049253 TaxID=3155274 RepID=UPI0034330D9F
MPDPPAVPSAPGSLVPDSLPVPDLLPVLMRKVRRRRRIRNGVTGGVAALAVAAGVALAVSLSLPDVSPPPTVPAVAAPPPALAMSALGEYPIQAAARIDPQSWGTEVEMSCSYRGGKGGDYSLVALGRDGTETQLATWKALPENTAKVVVGTPMKSQEIASLEIRSMRTGKPLMRLVYP